MKIDRGFENYKLVHNNFTFHKRDLNKFKNIFLKADSVEVDILNGLSFVLSLILLHVLSFLMFSFVLLYFLAFPLFSCMFLTCSSVSCYFPHFPLD